MISVIVHTPAVVGEPMLGGKCRRASMAVEFGLPVSVEPPVPTVLWGYHYQLTFNFRFLVLKKLVSNT